MGRKKMYAAVFSAMVLVVALGAGIAGSRSGKKELEKKTAELSQSEAAEPVDANKNAGQSGVKYNSTEENGSVGKYYQTPKSNDSGESPDKSEPVEKETPVKEEKNEIKTTAENSYEASAETMDDEEFVLADTPDAKPVFNWPLEGDVVMNFSTDALVYDSTLDQYRTNDSISISAPKGTVVKAAAAGTVESAAYDEESGYTVTVFHGSGWRTTYGQLDESTAVAQGEIVKAGDVIGTVAQPTKYSLSLGDHLDFAVLENETAVDPVAALE